MLSHILVSALLTAAQPANLNQARQNYSLCLGSLIRRNLRNRVDPAAFEAALANSCKAEEAAFRNASVATDVAAGVTRSNAEQNASFEITDMLDNAKGRYRDYIETNTEPR